jgi:predicted glycoside hydrolase/deacetylase ChbG (UPF0249 family)
MTRRYLLATSAAAFAPLVGQPHIRLILHADDLGNAHATNQAGLEMLEHGRVSSASLMMPCAWVAEVAEWLKSHPGADVGLHLTLTAEWKTIRWAPVAPSSAVPNLVDPQGYMWPDVRGVATRASAAEIETEVRAQIAKARRMGIRFTHLDTHMGTLYARPDYFEVYYKLGRELGVPIMLMKPSPQAEKQGSREIVAFLESQEARFREDGAFRLETLVPDPTAGSKDLAARRNAYLSAIEALPPGVHQLIIHPAKLCDETIAMTGTAVQRDLDYRIFSDPVVHSRLASKGIQLARYADFIEPKPA